MPRSEREGGASHGQPEPDPKRPAPESSARELAAKVVDLTNDARARAGCEPLHTDARLRRAALQHSTDMARRGYFAHTSPDGRSPWDRAEEHGYSKPSGENIARGYRTAAAVMDGWMDSKAHRENILNCRSQAIGVAVHLGGEKGPYWTQMFGYE